MNVNDTKNRITTARTLPIRPRLRRAFTLIELLVVIAITTIILTLLFAPLIQGFNFTRRARAISAAQDSARTGLALLRRELSQAAYIFDNANTPVSFPMQADEVGNNNRLPLPLINKIDPANAGSTTVPFKPALSFTKLDLVMPARINTAAGQVQDPTGGPAIDPAAGTVGTNVRFPLAPGTHIVRYFIGLRNNQPVGGKPAAYSNQYEFPRTDDEFNPFILYRAEFDAQDNRLFDTANATTYGNNTADSGGFNDPDFFYNQNTAPGGGTYAANWAKVAQPVIVNQNLDLMVIRRTDIRAIDDRNPFFTTVSFAPTTVVADTATPGFLSSDASEAPGAVPSLYTTKYGQWTLPYTVTFYRGATKNLADAGTLKVRVYAGDPDASGVRRLVVAPKTLNGNALPVGTYYASVSPTTQRIFIKTPQLTFLLDPSRGRIETGFPPLAGTAAGVPSVLDSTGTLRDMTAGSLPATDPMADNYGELVPTVFRINTRRTPDVGTTPPANQGFLNVRLMTNQQTGEQPVDEKTNPITPGQNYFLQSSINAALTTAPDNGAYPSPRAIFGYLLIAPGTERVVGPSSTFVTGGSSENVSYFRLPTFSDATLGQVVSLVLDNTLNPPAPAVPNVYRDFTISNPSYYFDYDLPPTDMLLFAKQSVTQAGANSGVPGLPAVAAGSTSQKELRATYLWQNNFARKFLAGDVPTDVAIGTPLDANSNSNISPNATNIGRIAGPPEPDVVKVDYSTRSVLAVNVGARVYDSGSGEAQFIQLADKIQINNVGR